MKYNRPEIAALGTAIERVQDPDVKSGLPNDGHTPDQTTISAYAADE